MRLYEQFDFEKCLGKWIKNNSICCWLSKILQMENWIASFCYFHSVVVVAQMLAWSFELVAKAGSNVKKDKFFVDGKLMRQLIKRQENFHHHKRKLQLILPSNVNYVAIIANYDFFLLSFCSSCDASARFSISHERS